MNFVISKVSFSVVGCHRCLAPRVVFAKIFQEAAYDRRFEEVNLFSLNHDRLLENFLRSEGIHVVDGFDVENTYGIRPWNPVLFGPMRTQSSGPVVRLLKLHGSIDWQRFRPREAQGSKYNSNPWREEYVGIRTNSELAGVKDESGLTT
ncbi:MAG: hypothetical protein H7A51_03250 [Akkermansiaceae bacterium]|nr:hypothetical protein [Akkermansiaceae bacterium]